jgi:hypothetical protein
MTIDARVSAKQPSVQPVSRPPRGCRRAAPTRVDHPGLDEASLRLGMSEGLCQPRERPLDVRAPRACGRLIWTRSPRRPVLGATRPAAKTRSLFDQHRFSKGPVQQVDPTPRDRQARSCGDFRVGARANSPSMPIDWRTSVGRSYARTSRTEIPNCPCPRPAHGPRAAGGG